MLPVDLNSFLQTVGYVGIWLIIFAETGLLIGFFLPGDSLLFTAGFLASQGHFNIEVLILVCFTAAVIGDAVGYSFGIRVGRGLFEKPDSRYFKQIYLLKAETFFEQHGGKAVIFARFVPIVRTFVPVVAGASRMPYRYFATYNVVGALLWAVGVTLLGYFLGERIPGVDKYLIPAILLMMTVSLLPTMIHIWREHGDDILLATRKQVSALFHRG